MYNKKLSVCNSSENHFTGVAIQSMVEFQTQQSKL